MKSLNLVGQKFGLLEVKERLGANSKGKVLWLCICECGNETNSSTGNLRSGISKSCGCIGRKKASERAIIRSTKHGHSSRKYKSSEYNSWTSMHRRCNCPAINGYEYYGGRGIKVCERWESFQNFLEDMGLKPSPKYSIDRIDNNKGYEPSNCKWSTILEQNRNRRCCKINANK